MSLFGVLYFFPTVVLNLVPASGLAIENIGTLGHFNLPDRTRGSEEGIFKT
jgi:hypothetical protein